MSAMQASATKSLLSTCLCVNCNQHCGSISFSTKLSPEHFAIPIKPRNILCGK